MTWIALSGLALYALSYLSASRNGFFEPVAYGLLRGRMGETILAPKACFGYRWTPFEGFNDEGGLSGVSLKGWFYYPMLMVDRTLWHRNELWESRRYRTKNYFDYAALLYRDIG